MSRFHKKAEQISHIAEKRRLSGGSMRCGKSAGALQTDGRELLYPGQAPCVFDQFREMDFGAFEGHNCEELKADVRYQAWIDSNGTLPFPQGESREQFQRRCVEGFCKLLKEVWTRERSLSSFALVVHGGTIMALLEAFAEGSYYDYQCAQMRRDTKDGCLWNLMWQEMFLRDTIKIADVRKLEE